MIMSFLPVCRDSVADFLVPAARMPEWCNGSILVRRCCVEAAGILPSRQVKVKCCPAIATGEADLVIAKGQGEFQPPSDEGVEICFLFKVKCAVSLNHAGARW
jgi:hypothetical protein